MRISKTVHVCSGENSRFFKRVTVLFYSSKVNLQKIVSKLAENSQSKKKGFLNYFIQKIYKKFVTK